MTVLDDTARLSAAQQPSPQALGPAQVERAQGAQPSASFREVYDAYFGFVWRSAANRGVPAAALDDVVQEVFIVIARKLPAFEGRSSLRTWIAGIVRRVIADYIRKRGNQPTGDQILTPELATSAAPSEALEQKAALELLDAMLAKMTEEQREVFLLHEIEQLSGAEIAELTGANENTVWTRLRTARRIFQEGVTRQRARHDWEQT
jgi:RNA polymerase sigma-70 factor (ECF subfamily)